MKQIVAFRVLTDEVRKRISKQKATIRKTTSKHTD